MGNVTFVTKTYVQIYSSSSRHFIQIKKTGVDASGVNGSQYGRDNVGPFKACYFFNLVSLFVCLFVCLFVIFFLT